MHTTRRRRDDPLKNDIKSRMYSTPDDKKALLPSVSTESKKEPTAVNPLSMEDRVGMIVLLLLYTLQGIPMGLCGSIPLIMKERGVSYEGLSLFSLVSVPFSLKLIWAPLVDSCYFKSIGRRKTWIIPVQILTGIVMLGAAPYVDSWMGNFNSAADGDFVGPQVAVLTTFFLFLYFLMATQDIIVDGWALTILSRENVGYASVCNSIGQSFGYFIANQGNFPCISISCISICCFDDTTMTH
jgi:MFS transporter, PAT family, solute carrier family 33 (acetyl-CoA transportor), member 1